MEEKEALQNDELKKVAGGIEPIFQSGSVICPVCGERGIKLIAGDEYTDTYQCSCCGSTSIHTKKMREVIKIHPNLRCPRCGDTIPSWTLLSSANGIDHIRCNTCRFEMDTPASQ